MEQPIPFFDGLASGLDELSGASPLFVNFLVDSLGAGHMRPGIQAWADFPGAPVASPVIGIYPWRNYVIFVTADRQIWAWLGPGLIQALSVSVTDSATTLAGGLRPSFTYDALRVVIVGGGAPQAWDGVAAHSSRLAPSATMPDGSALAFTHITYLAQRFVGNDYNLSGIFQWTDQGPGGHTSWPIVGASFVEAEASPDPLVALYANTNELFAFGTQTLQVFVPDATLVFAAATAVQLGCAAPYSVIDTDGQFAWLDDRHRFVQSDGRQFEAISTPQIANDIMQPGFVVSDCWGARMVVGTYDLLVWTFPTEGRCFVYDRVTKKWQGEFRALDENTGDLPAWTPNCYVYWAAQNKHLLGMPNGTIAEFSVNAIDDLGTPIEAISETGFQNRGTFVRKGCNFARLAIRRGGTPQPGPAPKIELSYRDTLGAFKPVIQFSTGVAGDYQPVVESKRNLGVYRQRQWRLSWTGGGPLAVTGATETFEVGDS